MTDLQRIETLFHAACDLAPEERAAFLARACADEPELRARVLAMLAEHDRDESLIVPAAARGAAASDVPTEGPGTLIDRYKLLQKIGEGGFGVVYMAEQEQPVRRKVALKIIKLGMDTREVVARFEAERQALALMDHPHIAKVLDGGATSTGRPYFVMELVRGISITEYCDQGGLSTAARLALFMQVCGAVQHAHQKGVIHRDLKPSNVLVTMNDGAPMPKVIDFGIAKAMHTRLTEKTLFTQFQRFIGTPAYMSPEQAELSALDVDTRSDIYSLGVLLYELLTGTVPFDPRTLVEAGLAEIQRVIREEPPERPSLRISTSGDATTASRRGVSDLHGLSRLLRGDLDWIVMRCLEKERGRRYSTAIELAADIQRHLDNVPVVAGPPSGVYRLRKFVARNKGGVVSAALVLIALVGGMVATGIAMHAASVQRDDALDAQEEAEDQRNLALGVTDFLLETLELADPAVTLAPDVSVSVVLEHASKRIQGAFEGQPWAEARVRSTIGRAYETLAEFELAEAHLRRAVETYETIDYDPVQYFDTLWSLTHLCFNLERSDAFAMAERSRVVGLEAVARQDPRLAGELERFTDLVKEGTLAMRDDVMELVPEAFERASAAANRSLAAGDPLWTIVSGLYAWCGFAMWYGPWEPLSIPIWRETLAIRRRELPGGSPDSARTLSQYVTVLSRAGQGEEAEREIADSLDRLRALLGTSNKHVAMLEGMLGQALVQQGQLDEAEPLLVHSYDVLAAEMGDTRFLVVDALARVVELYAAAGDERRAAEYRVRIAQALDRGALIMPWPIASLAFGPEHAPVLAAAGVLREHVGEEAYFAEPVAEGPAAAAAVDALLDAGAELIPREGPLAVSFARYLAYWEGGLKPGALDPQKDRMIGAALDVLEPLAARFPVEVAELRARRSEIAARRGDLDRARDLARSAGRLLSETSSRGDWFTSQAKVRVARSLVERELYAEAEGVLIPAYDVLDAQLGPRHSLTLELRALIARMYVGWQRPADAARFQPRTDSFEPAPR